MMDDLTICKKIAEIEGFNIVNSECFISVIKIKGTNFIEEYKPLTDDALCFQLMVKYGVERTYEPYDCLGWHCRVFDSKSPSAVLEVNCTYNDVIEISPNKAICLSIIEAHKESNNDQIN